jgi:nitric oxide dioxygenase
MFRGDMKEQGRKLMAVLASVVHGLGNLESVLPAARALAKRHVGYGVKASDYTPVGAALLWTLERGLAEQWTPELAAAWGAAYSVLSEFMIIEAYGASDVGA